MNKVYLQIWEESIKGTGKIPDGCTLHLTLNDNINYIKSIYKNRENSKIPKEYESAIGLPIEVYITDELYKIVESSNSIKLLQHEFNNLIQLEDITIF